MGTCCQYAGGKSTLWSYLHVVICVYIILLPNCNFIMIIIFMVLDNFTLTKSFSVNLGRGCLPKLY